MSEKQKCPLEPLHSNIILVQIEEEQKMYGSILVADLGKEKPIIGEVLAVGPGGLAIGVDHWLTPSTQVGDKVIVPSFGGVKISFEGIEYLIYKDSDIIAKI